jgi:hypothetical protein
VAVKSGSLWEDLNDLFEILFRLGGRIFGFIFCCVFAYQAYQAGRSALLGINTDGSAPVDSPESASSRFAAAAWCLIASSLAAIGFSSIIGFDIFAWALRFSP